VRQSVPRLSASRERLLVTRAQSGDRAARDALVAAFTPLVNRIASTYSRTPVPSADLVQEGLIALSKAIGRFDLSRGYRLSTFAQTAVKGAMLRAINTQAQLIRMPRVDMAKLEAITDMAARHRAQFGATPDAQDLHERWEALGGRFVEKRDDDPNSLWFSSAEVRSLLRRIQLGVTFFGLREGEQRATDEAYDMAELLSAAEEREAVRAAVRALDDEQAEVLSRRFGMSGGEPEQLHVIASALKLSRAEVRVIERTALALVRGAVDRALRDPPYRPVA
jgi:RNA polymerase primary sigma factor